MYSTQNLPNVLIQNYFYLCPFTVCQCARASGRQGGCRESVNIWLETRDRCVQQSPCHLVSPMDPPSTYTQTTADSSHRALKYI